MQSRGSAHATVCFGPTTGVPLGNFCPIPPSARRPHQRVGDAIDPDQCQAVLARRRAHGADLLVPGKLALPFPIESSNTTFTVRVRAAPDAASATPPPGRLQPLSKSTPWRRSILPHAEKRRFRQGLLCRPGGGVADASRHRATRTVKVVLDGPSPETGRHNSRRRQTGRHHGLDRRRARPRADPHRSRRRRARRRHCR